MGTVSLGAYYKGSGMQRKILLVPAPVARRSWPCWEMGRSPFTQILESKCVTGQLLDGMDKKGDGCLSGEVWRRCAERKVSMGDRREGQFAETGWDEQAARSGERAVLMLETRKPSACGGQRRQSPKSSPWAKNLDQGQKVSLEFSI